MIQCIWTFKRPLTKFFITGHERKQNSPRVKVKVLAWIGNYEIDGEILAPWKWWEFDVFDVIDVYGDRISPRKPDQGYMIVSMWQKCHSRVPQGSLL